MLGGRVKTLHPAVHGGETCFIIYLNYLKCVNYLYSSA